MGAGQRARDGQNRAAGRHARGRRGAQPHPAEEKDRAHRPKAGGAHRRAARPRLRRAVFAGRPANRQGRAGGAAAVYGYAALAASAGVFLRASARRAHAQPAQRAAQGHREKPVAAADAGHVVAVSDAIGQLLWVEGDNRLRSAAEAMHFMPGADWSERSAGTNAPGTALALGKPVQIFGPEHLGRLVTPWSCTAAPIRDPDTGIILGVLDITGGDSVASPQTLSLVRATVAAVESELRLARSHHPRFISASMSDLASPHLDVLSPHGATLRHGTTVTRLSQRHSEIMLLLAHAPDGLSSAELAVALSEQNYSDVSIRAEMTRLRPLLGPVQIGSKPYRLKTRVSLDIDDVRDHLAGGELRIALGKYQYPVLPHSVAPGVCEIRDELQMRIRAAVLSSADPETVLAFADSTHGAQDYEVWRHAYFLLPSGSPRRKYAASKCEKFESERE